MKRNLSMLTRRYASALHKYLKQGPRGSLQSAQLLGREAVRLGLETLDVTKIHEAALATVQASRGNRNGTVNRAKIFFAEAVTPIEKTHSAALKADAHLDEVNKTLDRQTVDLAVSNRSLKHGIIRRKAVEKALKKSGGNSKRLLEESHRLQQYLRHLTYRILTAQEDKRKKISRDLQDEVAQTLLGINVRLLTLKKEAAVNAKGFRKEIASTQRLVDKAGKTIKRFAREISKHYEG